MKVINQRENNQIITALADEEESSKDWAKWQSKWSSKDGRMVLLQDWSDCTLKCGGWKSV